ncbi:Bromodomain-containing protein [Coprinellus micaceus]|uniref:Bromodomain-containing protein n=1 Tax=Coprinellus micaceus TaxID=71717 RepID=A0A4Y7U0E9_COPMI|nr:Bromodomain-containing protein [Coprinellus micaceus]
MQDPGHAAPNGVHAAISPELAVSPAINGADAYSAHSPAADSPATPVSTAPAPDVKIDLDYPEQESDVRNEPIDIKHIAPFDQDMAVASHETPIDLVSSDVKMGDPHAVHTNGVNGNHLNGDVDMHDGHVGFKNGGASSPASSSRERPNDEDDDQPPAKRARILSDADKTSMTHSATPPPVSANVSLAASPAPPPPTTAATSTSFVPTPTPTPIAFSHSRISMAQFKYCQSCVRSLKKMKDAAPFLKPVDVVALNIPHYLQIVRHPMDFSTIERKLNSSNPAKPDPNPQNPRYSNVDEFVTDVRLIFTNCLTFNGPDHLIVQMGKRVEEVFDKQMRSMPPSVDPKPIAAPKKETPPPPPPPVISAQKKSLPVRRPSQSIPVVRRNEPEPISHRPKREIHPPPPKDLPYADAPKKPRNKTLHKKQYYNIAHPFYEPVDWMKMELPSYPKIVKKPMDLSTMRRKLDNRDYPTAQRFYDDFKLMIKNCMLFNPVGTPVCTAGQELEKVFLEKWRNLPPLRPVISDDEDDEDDGNDSDADRLRAIAQLEAQIETMRNNLEQLKSAAARSKKEKAKKKQQQEQRHHHRELPPAPSTSKPIPKQPKTAPKKTKKKLIPDDDVLTFEQKKDLSETIGTLEGAKLEKVINIIHEGVPEIRDSTEEIELEIDTLPASVLTKLYNFVIRPLKQPTAKRSRTGKGTGTGGLKRKSMDEDVEAEKIRQLEQRMALFDQGASGAPPPPPVRHGDGSDSDSSSGSSDSDSDSD